MLRQWGILYVVSYSINYSLFYEAFNKSATNCLQHLAQGLTFSTGLLLASRCSQRNRQMLAGNLMNRRAIRTKRKMRRRRRNRRRRRREIKGRAIAQAVGRRLPTMAVRVLLQVRSCGGFGGQSGIGASFLELRRYSCLLIPQTDPFSIILLSPDTLLSRY